MGGVLRVKSWRMVKYGRRPRGKCEGGDEEVERKCDEEREWNVKKLMSQMKLGFIKWKWSLVNELD